MREYTEEREEREDLILEYSLGRSVIVCPICSSLKEVKKLDEQMNHIWQCAVCGTSWEETSSHDIIVIPGRGK